MTEVVVISWRIRIAGDSALDPAIEFESGFWRFRLLYSVEGRSCIKLHHLGANWLKFAISGRITPVRMGRRIVVAAFRDFSNRRPYTNLFVLSTECSGWHDRC